MTQEKLEKWLYISKPEVSHIESIAHIIIRFTWGAILHIFTIKFPIPIARHMLKKSQKFNNIPYPFRLLIRNL